jgi:hypothetical protein
LVKVQIAIAGLVTLAAIVVQSLKKRCELVEVLQPLNILLRDFTSSSSIVTIRRGLFLGRCHVLLICRWRFNRRRSYFSPPCLFQTPLAIAAFFFGEGLFFVHRDVLLPS